MSRTLVLIDGTNYAFRVFYAIPLLTNSKGFPTNALQGFTGMLANYLRNEQPDYLAVAFDAKGPTFRKEQFDSYKAQRKEVPPELLQQMPYFRKVTEALNVPFLELSGFEADDVIATITRRCADPDLRIKIISMDKDLRQLVDDRVQVIDTLHNKVHDAAAVIDKFGVPPAQLREVLALMGDTSDNVPGVPGIGPKKAKDLILEFGSVEALYQNLDRVKNEKLRENLRAHEEQAKLSLELVTLHYDVPLEMPLESLRVRKHDPTACRELFRELEFRKYLREFGVDEEAAAREEGPSAVPVVDRAGLEALVAEAGAAPQLSLRVVGEGSPLTGSSSAIALAISADRSWFIPLTGEASVDRGELVALLGPLLARPDLPKIGHDLKQDVLRLHRLGITLGGIAGDTALCSYLLNPSRSSHALGDLARIFLDRDLRTDGAQPGVDEARLILTLHTDLERRLQEVEMGRLYHELEVPLLRILADMELLGIRVDTARLAALSELFDRQIKEMEARIYSLAGETFNANSPKQLQQILFEKLKLPMGKKTKTGPSTDQEVLEALAEEHPLPAEILAFRSIVKLKNTYVDILPKLVDPSTSRIHTTFNQTVAATGRLSSSDPNLQNIPIRGEEGKKIREAFVAAPGCKLLSADYSQIELRLLAHFCEDETLIHAFTHGIDIHAVTAADMFGVALPLVTGDMRRAAKVINFGILYGMGGHRLARELKITRKAADEYISRYFARYARVKTFLDATLEGARVHGYVTTLYHRRRYIPDIGSSNHNVRQGAERIAVNTPIQGSAADIIKLAMREVHTKLEAGGFSARMLLQVHDELIFEVPEAELEDLKGLVKSGMEGVVSLRVPLTVELGTGSNWAEAH